MCSLSLNCWASSGSRVLHSIIGAEIRLMMNVTPAPTALTIRTADKARGMR